MMRAQRVREAGSRIEMQIAKWTAEGAVKCGFHKVFCDVAGRRHLPGIYWYPTKRMGHAVNQGGTADSFLDKDDQSIQSAKRKGLSH